MQKAALYTAGALFAATAVSHAYRVITGMEIFFDGMILPVWVSLPAALIAAVLAIWMFIAARRG